MSTQKKWMKNSQYTLNTITILPIRIKATGRVWIRLSGRFILHQASNGIGTMLAGGRRRNTSISNIGGRSFLTSFLDRTTFWRRHHHHATDATATWRRNDDGLFWLHKSKYKMFNYDRAFQMQWPPYNLPECYRPIPRFCEFYDGNVDCCCTIVVAAAER